MTAPLPQDPADVTDGDRAKAHALWNELLCNGEVPGWNAMDTIAAALAAERAAVTRPVLALAEELDSDAQRHDDAEPITTDGLLRMVLAARHCREHATRLRAAVAAALGETGGGQ